MDSLRVYASSIHLCPSRNRQHNPSNHFRFLLPSIPPPPPHLRPLHLRLPPLISAVSSSPQTQTSEGKKSMKRKVGLDHQVQFGNHLVLRGSTMCPWIRSNVEFEQVIHPYPISVSLIPLIFFHYYSYNVFSEYINVITHSFRIELLLQQLLKNKEK